MYYGYGSTAQPAMSGMAKFLAAAPIILGVASKMYEAYCNSQEEQAKRFANSEAYAINHYVESGPDGKKSYVYVLNDGTVLRSESPFTINYSRR